MPIDRRMLGAAFGLGALGAASAEAAGPRRHETSTPGRSAAAQDLGVRPDSGQDVTAAMQQAIDRAAERRVPLVLAPGRYLVRNLRLRPGSSLAGNGQAVLSLAGDGAVLVAEQADGLVIDGLALDGGAHRPLAAGGAGAAGLVVLHRCRNATLRGLAVGPSRANGIVLSAVGGRLVDSTVTGVAEAAIVSLDAQGLEIGHNHVADCANNGILVWRSSPGEDGTIVAGNRIERIRAEAGGSGQNGNGINVYRAGGVLVTGNRIADCAYTAIRGNAASNVQMVANSCQRLGEVALYAEFGFEGALIASNLVDDAAAGISVTNFNEGGRLAVVQGNLIRNLRRREHEPEDKRGEGIAVEADTIVTGNVVENAPTAGISVGWGPYMRDVAVTSNIVRRARVGIQITRDPGAGAALIAQNMITGTPEGAIRAMDKGVLVGPDLARAGIQSARITIAGNAAM